MVQLIKSKLIQKSRKLLRKVKYLTTFFRDLSSKRKFHNEKFGYGGKKRGIKVNTKQSVDDVSGYKSFRNAKGGRQKKSAAGKQKRMGKERRHKMKSKKK